MSEIRIRKDAPSGTIVLDNPARCNALGRHSAKELADALRDFQQERSVRAVILTGAGETFCSGRDLHELKASLGDPNRFQVWQDEVSQFRDLVELMLRYPKPIIASVNGPVVGSGLALVLAADIVVGCEEAFVRLPEVRRGLIAGFVAPLISFRVGSGLASYLMNSSEAMSAQRCFEVGLFHELTSRELVWVRAHELAKSVALGARHSFVLNKQGLNEAAFGALLPQLSDAAINTATSRSHDETAEGLLAFLEKRPPDWSD